MYKTKVMFQKLPQEVFTFHVCKYLSYSDFKALSLTDKYTKAITQNSLSYFYHDNAITMRLFDYGQESLPQSLLNNSKIVIINHDIIAVQIELDMQYSILVILDSCLTDIHPYDGTVLLLTSKFLKALYNLTYLQEVSTIKLESRLLYIHLAICCLSRCSLAYNLFVS